MRTARWMVERKYANEFREVLTVIEVYRYRREDSHFNEAK